MALVLDLKTIQLAGDGGRKQIRRVYDVTFTGSYAGSGAAGDPIDFTSSTIITNSLRLERAKPGFNPNEYAVQNNPPGFLLVITPGASLASGWGLRIYQTGAGNNQPFSELANGAYPAGLTGITAGVRLEFREPSK
jgi:hypothetical protein